MTEDFPSCRLLPKQPENSKLNRIRVTTGPWGEYTVNAADGVSKIIINLDFLRLRIHFEHKFVKRALDSVFYSFFAFLVRTVGKGTAMLNEAAVGDRAMLVGPAGNGFPDIPDGKKVILVGGGTGIAPLHHLMAELVRQDRGQDPIELLHGARDADSLYIADRLQALPFAVDFATEDGSQLAVLTYNGVWLFTVEDGSVDYFKGSVSWLPIRAGQCEAICFDGEKLVISNEGGRLFEVSLDDLILLGNIKE